MKYIVATMLLFIAKSAFAGGWLGDSNSATGFSNSGSGIISLSCDDGPSMVVATANELTKVTLGGNQRAPITVYFPGAEFQLDFVSVEFGTPDDGEGSTFAYGVKGAYPDEGGFRPMFYDMTALMGVESELYLASLDPNTGQLAVFSVFSLDGAAEAIEAAGC